MKIGILGSGVVAQSLGAGLHRHGHQVMLGSSAPERLAPFATAHAGLAAARFADAARFGDLVILAVKGTAALAAIDAAGADARAGKVVIDATNPIADQPPVNGVFVYFTGPNESLLERLQGAWPTLRFVKAFNSVGHAHFVDPSFPGGPPTMFICGNDAAAKADVVRLLASVGWDSADMGGVESARAIEPLCMLW